MKQTKIKVTLLSHTKDPERTIVAAIRQCYSPLSGYELWEKVSDDQKRKLIRQVISSGHTSTIEHASFTFAIEGVSRVTEVQTVRHRIGASYSIKSGRYNPSHSDFVVPPKIAANTEAMKVADDFKKDIDKMIEKFTKLGFAFEDIRYLTPQGTKTNFIMTMNARALFNFFAERLCLRTQWEIRQMATQILAECLKIAPNVFKYAGPTCVTEKICWQGKMNCGKPEKNKSIELRERF